ncbi:MAG: twin-arginine translocase TatA/TatE family subunit [bacterium]
MVGSLGWTELLVISAVVIIFLGKGNQLPEITRALGNAVREFKDAANPDVTSSELEEPKADPEPNDSLSDDGDGT